MTGGIGESGLGGVCCGGFIDCTPLYTYLYLKIHCTIELTNFGEICRRKVRGNVYPYLDRIPSPSNVTPTLTFRIPSLARIQNVHSSPTDMGPSSGKRCQGWLQTILRSRHGCTYETQVSVSIYNTRFSLFEFCTDYFLG